MEKIKVAICYDFDQTLSKECMQNYDFIKSFKMSNDEFWEQCNQFSKENCSDGICSYLYTSLRECKKNGIKPTREFFKSCGKNIEYYNGVETWFERINKFAESKGVELEHYIISSGIKAMIEGTKIAKYFKNIYACEYCYDEDGNAYWPSIIINYTDKTQFLYRINKGIFTPNDKAVNNYQSKEDRYIPFENIIYIGDSETDIPSMKLIRLKKGYAIGVYNAEHLPEYYQALINQDRVDYIAKADYSKDSELNSIVQELIETIYHKSKLREINKHQKQLKAMEKGN